MLFFQNKKNVCKKIILDLIYIINICALSNVFLCSSSSGGTGGKKSGFVFEGVWQLQPEDREYEILYLEFVFTNILSLVQSLYYFLIIYNIWC